MLVLVPTALEAERLLDGPCPQDARPVATRIEGYDVEAALVGFGPIAAGAMAALALRETSSEAVCLAGVAGTYHGRILPVGALVVATEALCADVGRGQGHAFLGPEALGLPQVPAAPGRPPIYDRCGLAVPRAGAAGEHARGPVLTVSRASANLVEAAGYGEAHPDALAEEMEGFSVALAAACLGRRVHVLRGISNVAGVTDRRRWRIDDALRAVRAGLVALLASQGSS